MINYKIINDSIAYYNNWGFERIEVPWTVSEYVENLTKPKEAVSCKLQYNDKCLVGSGEQSFLYLYLKEFLPKGQYQAVTPCFRFENYDYLHNKYFIKNELIKTDIVNHNELVHIVDHCLKFFRNYLPDCVSIVTEQGFDIEWNGYELGSYGIRKNEFLEYIYATGVAEPRLSKLINIKNGISHKED
mgnify:CR=1 FL=1